MIGIFVNNFDYLIIEKVFWKNIGLNALRIGIINAETTLGSNPAFFCTVEKNIINIPGQ